MKIVNEMNYRDWQKRNSKTFANLNKLEQIKARSQGYCNNGWPKIISSWDILCQFKKNNDSNPKLSSLFDYKLRKGDLVGAIDLSILEADKAKEIAQNAIKTLEEQQAYLDQLADDALAKYPLL